MTEVKKKKSKKPKETKPPAPLPSVLGQTHLAEVFAECRFGAFIYVHGIGWHYWDGTRWALDIGEAQTRQELLKVLKAAYKESIFDPQISVSLKACFSDGGQRGALAIAATLPAFTTKAEELDADPYQLNCANGTLDLHTFELNPHNPSDLITKITRAAYDPDASAPVLDEFLARVLPDEEVRAYLQKVMGLALLGKVREHILPIGTGTGGNGKGTFYEAALHALGDYAHMAEQELFIATRASNGAESAKPAQLALRGKRFIVCSETNEGAPLNAALMKNLTGGDKITARAVYGRTAVTFAPSHTALMITNYLPKVRGDDEAIWRRIRVIPFDVVIPKTEWDKQLAERLELAADAFLLWAVQGFKSYVEAGNDMQEPDAVLARTAAYRNESDAFARFLKECTVDDPSAQAVNTEVWDAWVTFSHEEKAEKITRAELYKKLEEHGYSKCRISSSKRGFNGLALITQEEDAVGVPIDEEGIAEL